MTFNAGFININYNKINLKPPEHGSLLTNIQNNINKQDKMCEKTQEK